LLKYIFITKKIYKLISKKIICWTNYTFPPLKILNNYFKNDLKKTFLNLSKNQIRQYSIKIAIENGVNGGLFLELGVLNGASINLFADFLEKEELKIYGFDSFQGFSSNWPRSHLQSRSFNREGILPKVKKNVELIKGNVIDTFEKFLEEKKKYKFYSFRY